MNGFLVCSATMKLACWHHNKWWVVFFFPSPCFLGRCDRGFGGSFCVPVVPLPSILKDDFNGNLHPDLWPEVYGAERGNLNGEAIKSGTSLIFKGVSSAPLCSSHIHWAATPHTRISALSGICYFTQLMSSPAHSFSFYLVYSFFFFFSLSLSISPPHFLLASKIRSCCVLCVRFWWLFVHNIFPLLWRDCSDFLLELYKNPCVYNFKNLATRREHFI